MKKFYVFLLSLVLLTLSISCEKDANTPGPDPQPTEQSDVTPVGNPVGTAVSVTIGPAGGHIESGDQRVRIDIPAGALASSQTISVQPLDENHCPGGSGAAFRLLPHGLTFAKPATITFRYEQEDMTDTAPELLRVAFQSDARGWYSPSTSRVDTTARLVIASTTHFSDWTILKSAIIDPSVQAIDPGASANLSVRAHIEVHEPDGKDIPVFTKIDSKFVDKWTVQGAGHIEDNDNATATYTAPERIPATNPQVVTVVLSQTINNVKRQIKLHAKIYVLGEGLVFRINGGQWIPTTSPLGLSKVVHGNIKRLLVTSGLSAPGLFASVTLSWPEMSEKVNSYIMPWQLKTNDNEMRIPIIYLTTNPKGTPLYAFFYEQNKATYPSPGNLQIAKIGLTTDDYYIGSFTLKRAGILEYSGGTDQVFDGIAEVEGYFRFKVGRSF
ncbi:hypothetical protein ACWKW6_29940 [Dyadobacter jiangsuensis]